MATQAAPATPLRGALQPMFDAEFDRQMSLAMRQHLNMNAEVVEILPALRSM